MKMMKLWRNILVMTAAMLSLASCSSDDDSNVYEAAELGGTWQKVYDEIGRASCRERVCLYV